MMAGATIVQQFNLFPCSSGHLKTYGKRFFPLPCREKRRLVSPVKASFVSEGVLPFSTENYEKRTTKERSGVEIGQDLTSIVSYWARSALRVLKPLQFDTRRWPLQAESFVETSIVNCRFFVFIGVVGSLTGSILCFVEGCFVVAASYFRYFRRISQKLDQGDVVHLVIEAIDMFLIGTAMLNFGMGLYAMFIGSKKINRWPIPGLLRRLSNLTKPPDGLEMKSVLQAKTKLGHALVILLQAGMVEKFKNVPLVTGLDLACFAGAILTSSACMFLLSRLHSTHHQELEREELGIH